MTTAKHYYECHVTIEPVFGESLKMVRAYADMHEFKVADLLMQKRTEDTPERSAHDTFMTGHGKELEALTIRLVKLVACLRLAGYKVWRYKIEDTVMDSRINDELGVL